MSECVEFVFGELLWRTFGRRTATLELSPVEEKSGLSLAQAYRRLGLDRSPSWFVPPGAEETVRSAPRGGSPPEDIEGLAMVLVNDRILSFTEQGDVRLHGGDRVVLQVMLAGG